MFQFRRVLVFGTFDVFHAGHDFFLSSAASRADTLSVLVARDEHVRQLKGKNPIQTESTRLFNVSAHPKVTVAYLSDEILGSYKMLLEINPDLILLGFDQMELGLGLERFFSESGYSFPVKILSTYD